MRGFPVAQARDSTNLRAEACEFGPITAVTARFIGLDETDPYYASKGTHAMYVGQQSGEDNSGAIRSGVTNGVIANCIFYGTCAGRHIQLGPQFRDGFVVNNTFYGNQTGDLCTRGSPNCEYYAGTAVEFWGEGGTYQTANVVVANNIMSEMFGHAAYGSGSSSTTRYVFNNIGFSCDNGAGHQDSASDTFEETYEGSSTLFVETKPDSSSAPNSVTDPLLADPMNRDFTPDTGSPAIGASLLSWTPEEDYNGDARSASTPTIGALEVGTTIQVDGLAQTRAQGSVTVSVGAEEDPGALSLTVHVEGTLTITLHNEGSETLTAHIEGAL